MALTGTEHVDPRYKREWQEGFMYFVQRAIVIGSEGTLASANCEFGDMMPLSAFSTYEIIKARAMTDAKDGQRIALVTAILDMTE